MKSTLFFLISILVFIQGFGQQDHTPPMITDMSFSPDPVDVTSGEQTVTFEFTATDDLSGLKVAYVNISSPSGLFYQTGPGLDGSTEQTRSFSFTIPQYSEPGEYYVSAIHIYDMVDNEAWYYKTDFENAGLTPTFDVISIQDVTPPMITDMSFSPDPVDVTSGEQTVTFEFTATDDLSGLKVAYVNISSPSGLFYQTGPGLDGSTEQTRSFSFTIPQYSEPGEYYVSAIHIYDMVDNEAWYYKTDFENAGLTPTFDVISIQDVTPPMITDMSFSPDPVDVTSGEQTVTFEFTATDDLSGLKVAYVNISSPSGLFYQTGPGLDGSTEQTRSFSFTIPQYSEPGEYYVSAIHIYDMVDNEAWYYKTDFENAGLTPTFDVISIQDVTPPMITDMSFSPDPVDVTSGEQTVTFEFTATDDLSGLKVAYVNISSPSGLFYQTGPGLDGSTEQTRSFSFTIPQYSEPGEYYVSAIHIYDMVDNEAWYYKTDFENAGLTPTFDVYDGSNPISICQNTTLQMNETGNAFLDVSMIDGGSLGTNLSLSISQTTFTCTNLGVNDIILTATDENQNTSECTAQVEILDNDNDGDRYTVCNEDCDDSDPDIYPGAPEFLDCLDNDCDGWTDEEHTSLTDHVWTGCNETDSWDHPSNWNANTVPQSRHDVIVPGTMMGRYYPSINAAFNVNSLTIEDGAVMYVEARGNINIHNIKATPEAALTIHGLLDNSGGVTVNNNVSKGIVISGTGTFIHRGSCSINAFSLYGLENYGVFQLTNSGSMDIQTDRGNGIYNWPRAEITIEGILRIIK